MDKPTYHKTILCLLGIHKTSKYVFNRIDGKDYCICRICGKRLNKQRNNQ